MTTVLGTTTASDNELEIDDSLVEFFDADFNNLSDNEDVSLYSVTFNQKGSVAASDFKSVKLTIERDVYYPTVVGDDYIFVFPKGIRIRENDDIDVILEGNVRSGVDRSIQFVIEEPSDVYVVGQDYGYGLPITINGTSSFTTDILGTKYTDISGGDISVRQGNFLTARDRDLQDGADDQIIGGFEIEVRGETYSFRGLRATILFDAPSGFSISEVDDSELEVRNIRINSGNQTIGHADNEITITQSGDTTVNIEFDDTFELEPGTHEITIRGDLDSEFPDGARFVVTITGFDEVEGITSRTDITNDTDKNTVAGDGQITLKSTTVEGDLVDFDFRSSERNRSIVASTQNIVFGEIRIDAENSTRSLFVQGVTLKVSALKGGVGQSLRQLDNCELRYNGTRVADQRGTNSGIGSTYVDFDFEGGNRGWEINGGESREIDVVCDVKEFDTDTEIVFSTEAVSATDGVITYIDYYLDGLNDQKVAFAIVDGTVVTIVNSGTLDVNITSVDTRVVASGDDGSGFAKIGTLLFQADNESITIDDITLHFTSPNSNWYDSIAQVRLTGAGVNKTEAVSNNSSSVRFENISLVIEDDNRRKEVDVEVRLQSIGKNYRGISGTTVIVALTTSSINATGDDSSDDVDPNDISTPSNNTIGGVTGYRTVPTFVEKNVTNTILTDGTVSNRQLYVFGVRAESDGDVTVGQVSFSGTKSTGLTVANAELRVYTNSGLTTVYTGNGISDGVVDTIGDFDPTSTVRVDISVNPVIIPAGQTYYFELEGDVTSADGHSISVKAVFDTNSSGVGQEFSDINGSNNFVWSPDSEQEYIVDTADSDWFNGGNLQSNDELNAWDQSND